MIDESKGGKQTRKLLQYLYQKSGCVGGARKFDLLVCTGESNCIPASMQIRYRHIGTNPKLPHPPTTYNTNLPISASGNAQEGKGWPRPLFSFNSALRTSLIFHNETSFRKKSLQKAQPALFYTIVPSSKTSASKSS